MKKKLTELVFILDKSGSMAGLENDTVEGVNRFTRNTEELKGDCLVTIVFFSDESRIMYDRVNVKDIPPLTREDFVTGGCTALNDAAGQTITRIDALQKSLEPGKVPDNTMVIIITDGYENASTEYTAGNVKDLILKKKEQGWEFIFLGANIESAETGAAYGIDRSRTADYIADKKGTASAYESTYFACASMINDGVLPENWSSSTDKDRKNRKNRK